jgi:hypothetical protein
MVSVQAQDAIDLELQRDLEQALHKYQHAVEGEKADARVDYHAKLDAFSARVLHRQLGLRLAALSR